MDLRERQLIGLGNSRSLKVDEYGLAFDRVKSPCLDKLPCRYNANNCSPYCKVVCPFGFN